MQVDRVEDGCDGDGRMRQSRGTKWMLNIHFFTNFVKTGFLLQNHSFNIDDGTLTLQIEEVKRSKDTF